MPDGCRRSPVVQYDLVGGDKPLRVAARARAPPAPARHAAASSASESNKRSPRAEAVAARRAPHPTTLSRSEGGRGAHQSAQTHQCRAPLFPRFAGARPPAGPPTNLPRVEVSRTWWYTLGYLARVAVIQTSLFRV
jgi:hypothetical protein